MGSDTDLGWRLDHRQHSGVSRFTISAMIDWDARVADDDDPLRRILEAARAWHVPPHVFMGEPAITTYLYDQAGRMVRSETVQWTAEDRAAALALADYEAGLCPGGPHPLSETTKPEHEDAYRAMLPIRCHYCTAEAIVAESKSEGEGSAGLLYPIRLDADVVALNKLPVPPMPVELLGG